MTPRFFLDLGSVSVPRGESASEASDLSAGSFTEKSSWKKVQNSRSKDRCRSSTVRKRNGRFEVSCETSETCLNFGASDFSPWLGV